MSRIIRPKEACQLLGGISPSTLYLWVQQGKIPPPQKIVEGGRAAGWPEDVIKSLITKKTPETTN